MAKDEKLKKNKSVKESRNGFLKDSKSELKKVIWPTPKSLVNDTATVIGIVLIVAIIVVILDVIFFNFNENVIIKAEEKVKGNNTSVVTELNPSTSENQGNAENNENTENSENNTDAQNNQENEQADQNTQSAQ